MEPDIQHEEGKRYFIQFGNERAEASYREMDKTRDFHHTYVPPQVRGRGIAELLVRHALDDSMRNGYKLKATCPYVEAFVKRHPEYQKGLAS
ncbi:MAG TPA: GNAT family N-acetyltransferase [Thermoanaerobaculia bacterium]|nr:GNAT family N-acetyltransferase [Thermoanaerobaculia bacterium]